MKNKRNLIMAKTTKKEKEKQEITKQETPVAVTRAEKKDAAKNVIREILAVKPLRHNELIDEAAKLYTERFGGDNVNDVNGRIGSVLDIMKKESDVMYDGGMYALKARGIMPPPEKKVKKSEEKTEEKTEKKTVRTRAKKTTENAVKTDETLAQKEEVKAEETAVEQPVKKARKPRAKKEEKAEPLPAAPLQPIAPVAPITPETAPEPIPEKEEKAEPKKRGRKPKATAEKTVKKAEEKSAEKPIIENPPVVKAKAEVAEKNVVMDMSFLFGAKAQKAQKSSEEKVEKSEQKTDEKPVQKPLESKPVATKIEAKRPTRVLKTVKKVLQRPLTADEKLRENFLKRLRSLGGDYFEYYSVYLLERYSMKNGRRLEGLKISGGDHDGGIDGEIELTDKLGFRETIYIQAKNWNPEKGDERLWVVGETLLQQFIGACACRQVKDKKQHCRGIFITTSRFTPEAKRILNDLSDKIVGYDGEDLFEAAKECKFGLLYENGNWKLDEKLLSGTKAFFNLY